MSDLMEIANLVSDYAVKKYSKKIALIAVYGSIAQGTESEYSDLDMYAIVDDETDKIEISFLYNDTPVDMWFMSWKTAEKMAQGIELSSPWCVSASIFINCQLIYTRSKGDLEKFETLGNYIENVKRSPTKNLQHVLNKFDMLFSIEKIKLAKDINDLLYARWAVWGLINNITSFLSWMNNTFYTKNWGSNFPQVNDLPIIPDDLNESVRKICCSDDFDEILTIAYALIMEMRRILRNLQTTSLTKIVPLEVNHFIHMKEYFNKVLSACDRKDIITASYASTELQVWISEMLSELRGFPACDFNFFQEIYDPYLDLNLPDLTAFITKQDFQGLKEAVKELESLIYRLYNNTGLKIPIFRNIEEIKSYLVL
jgi:hypothetical protein